MFYIKLNQDKIIQDAINYPHDGYIELDVETLPVGVNGGWWKYENGVLVEMVELNPHTIDNKIKLAIDEYTLSLIEMGVL